MAEKRIRPLESAAARQIYARLDVIEAERGRCDGLIKTTEAEIARLESAIKAQEAERDAKSGALAQEAIASDELSAKGLVDRILTQKSVEGSLNQMRDSVAKLAAAVIEAGKTLRKLRIEEDRLGKDLVALEQAKKFENAQKHFKSFVSSWEDAERDHAEFVRLLTELRDVGIDMKRMAKAAGVADDSLFAAVASGTFIFNRHTVSDFAIEMGSKRAIPGNPFYKGETARVQMGKSDFRKGHAFNGCFFAKQ
jgi:hypothetical protein